MAGSELLLLSKLQVLDVTCVCFVAVKGSCSVPNSPQPGEGTDSREDSPVNHETSAEGSPGNVCTSMMVPV